jgi:hypothetical protein
MSSFNCLFSFCKSDCLFVPVEDRPGTPFSNASLKRLAASSLNNFVSSKIDGMNVRKIV